MDFEHLGKTAKLTKVPYPRVGGDREGQKVSSEGHASKTNQGGSKTWPSFRLVQFTLPTDMMCISNVCASDLGWGRVARRNRSDPERACQAVQRRAGRYTESVDAHTHTHMC